MSQLDSGIASPTLDSPHEGMSSSVETKYVLPLPNQAGQPMSIVHPLPTRPALSYHKPDNPCPQPDPDPLPEPDLGPADSTTTDQMLTIAFPLPGALFWFYLLCVATIEAATVMTSWHIGMGLYTSLLMVLTLHSGLGRRDETRKLALVLTLVPLVRLLALSLPLMNAPQETWYAIVAVLLFLVAWVMVHQSGLPQRDVGLHTRNRTFHLLMITGGLGVGTIQYAILQPRPLDSPGTWGLFTLLTLLPILSTGFTEELIFRGLMQSLAIRVMGRWALLYGAMFFAVLHIGYLSIIGVGFALVLGLLFGQIVYWSRSILGVSLVHAVANVMQFVLLPQLMQVAAESTGNALWLSIMGLVTPGIIPFILVLMTIALCIVLLVLGYMGSLP